MKLVIIIGDLHVGRINKILGENIPKFLDLKASIYGTLCYEDDYFFRIRLELSRCIHPTII